MFTFTMETISELYTYFNTTSQEDTALNEIITTEAPDEQTVHHYIVSPNLHQYYTQPLHSTTLVKRNLRKQ